MSEQEIKTLKADEYKRIMRLVGTSSEILMYADFGAKRTYEWIGANGDPHFLQRKNFNEGCTLALVDGDGREFFRDVVGEYCVRVSRGSANPLYNEGNVGEAYATALDICRARRHSYRKVLTVSQRDQSYRYNAGLLRDAVRTLDCGQPLRLAMVHYWAEETVKNALKTGPLRAVILVDEEYGFTCHYGREGTDHWQQYAYFDADERDLLQAYCEDVAFKHLSKNGEETWTVNLIALHRHLAGHAVSMTLAEVPERVLISHDEEVAGQPLRVGEHEKGEPER